MNRTELPQNPKLAGKVLEAEHESRKLEMGKLGWIWGGVAEKPGNIAGFVIIVSLVALCLTIVVPDSAQVPKKEIFTLFGGIITLTLGFLFGRTTST